MANLELVDSQQESLQKSPEQLAKDKFDALFRSIGGQQSYKNSNGETINIGTASADDNAIRNIFIEKNGNTTYRLSCRKTRLREKFTLNYGPNLGKVIENVTPQELLNNILPKIEKRIKEAKNYQRQQRQRALENANQYAYQQDQQDADKLLQENELA